MVRFKRISSYAFSELLTPKKDDNWHLCGQLRHQQITVGYKFPILD